MALGVLNNLSAIYAENNLNNTNNSLQQVLQQLSSGSRINSGADDAAGLSLVNGLAANSAALTQSGTNATEGVGLLQVADGALSQVTSLLDRAITLATEASNGTLNSTQEAAANQEYQSILSEINNIGSTTTFNQEQVFNGQQVAIYTGDSSTTGSSVDELYLRTLSESSVGDSGGVMSYSNGQNNVFLNLSTATQNAATTDTLNTSGETTIDVNYLVKGANGEKTTASTQISVGSGTSYANNVSGLISAINDSGLGLTATFTTQAEAGVTGGGKETGIEITGGLVSAGFTPSSVSTGGTLNPAGIPASELLTQGQTITVTQDGNTIGSVEINPTINNLQELMNAINTGTGTGVTGFTGAPVEATVITNGDGTQSLSLANAGASDGTLNVSVAPPVGTAPALSFSAAPPTAGASVTVQTQGTTTAGTATVQAQASTVTVGTGSGTELGTDILTAGTSVTIKNTIPNDTQTLTFIVGSGTNNPLTGTFYTENGTGNDAADQDTLQGMANTINAENSTLGVYATVGANGLTLTTGTWNPGSGTGTPTALAGENISVTSNSLASSTAGATGTQLSLYSPQVAGVTPVGGAPAVTVLDDGTGNNLATNTLSGSITLTNSYGSYTFVSGGGTDTSNTFYLGNYAGGSTYNGLVAAITAHSAELGYGAGWVANAGAGGKPALVLTASADGANPITVASTLQDTSDLNSPVGADGGAASKSNGADTTLATNSTAILQLGSGNIADATALLGGAISLTFNGNTQTFIIGNEPANGTAVPGAIYTGGYPGANNVAQLVNAINSAGALGLQAEAPGGGTGGIFLQGGAGIGSAITMNAVPNGTETPLAVVTTAAAGAVTPAVTGVPGGAAVDNITAENGSAQATQVGTGDTMAGSIKIVNNGGTAYTFTIGSGADTATTFYTNNTGVGGTNYGDTLADLATLITAEDATTGVSAQANTSGLTLTQTGTIVNGNPSYAGGSITTSANTLTDVTEGSYSTVTLGTFASENDSVNGTMNFEVGGAPETVTLNANSTVATMIQQINGYNPATDTNSYPKGVSASWVPTSNGFGNVVLTSLTEGTNGNITNPLAAITDTTATATLTYTAGTAYDTGLTSASVPSNDEVYDSSTGQTGTAAGEATFVSDARSGSGIATTSYSDGSGQALSGTDLLNTSDSETALNDLNVAISDAAAQDGYVGAQINTLNALSQVMSTQQENIVSAQNAVQATDYASATSNMSKYEILSQTGIAALAQANQVQQEVLKLLQ